MYSAGYLLIAVVDLAVLAWAARLCLRYRTSGVIFASFPLLLVWFDNLVIGLGSVLGEGDVLQSMNAMRFVAHFISLPMGFIAVGAIAREAGFAWAKPAGVMGLFCALAAGFIVYDLWQFSTASLYPACFADTLRYTTRITEYSACGPSADIGAGKLISPAPAIILTATVIAFGIYLWIETGWKWLVVMAGASMLFFAIPMEATGGIVANVGEPVFIGAIVATAAHIAQGALTRQA